MSQAVSKGSLAVKIWDSAQRSEHCERIPEPSPAPAAGRGEDTPVLPEAVWIKSPGESTDFVVNQECKYRRSLWLSQQ